MSVTMTEAAAKHVGKALAQRGKGIGLRLGVRTAGCSGMAYRLEYVDDLADEDSVFESHGVKIVIDPKSQTAEKLDVLIHNGRILKIGNFLQKSFAGIRHHNV